MSATRPNWKEAVAPYARASVPRAILDLATSVVPYLLLMALQMFLLNDGVAYWVLLPLVPLTAGFLLRTYIVFHDCTH
ncbi:MAG: hypothetical protein QOI80_1675, partial [Solirubrobacteraceae bacterium]|nr:hypothetical protein [Solirubrobacteraceae bacterium]